MFQNMKVAVRLTILASALLIFMLIIGALGIQGMREANQGMRTVYVDRVEPMRDLKDVIDNFALTLVDTPQKTAKGLISPQEALRITQETLPATDALWAHYLTTFLIEDEKKTGQPRHSPNRENPPATAGFGALVYHQRP